MRPTLTTQLRFLPALLAIWLAAPLWAQEPALTILQPRAEETIHSNDGRVAVAVVVDAQDREEGLRMRLLLDGAPAASAQEGASQILRAVPRGEHTLQALLVDAAGNIVATSEPVRFYMWRASELFPNRKK